jgi:hypothetical protein
VDAERGGFRLDVPRGRGGSGGGGGGGGRTGDDGPSREFASAASSLLDDDFGAEVRARARRPRRRRRAPRWPSVHRREALRAARAQDKAGADDGAAPVVEQLVFSEGDPDYEDDYEDPGRAAEEYDYEHFWDLAALEDAPPEDPLEAELAAARAEYAELVRGPGPAPRSLQPDRPVLRALLRWQLTRPRGPCRRRARAPAGPGRWSALTPRRPAQRSRRSPVV